MSKINLKEIVKPKIGKVKLASKYYDLPEEIGPYTLESHAKNKTVFRLRYVTSKKVTAEEYTDAIASVSEYQKGFINLLIYYFYLDLDKQEVPTLDAISKEVMQDKNKLINALNKIRMGEEIKGSDEEIEAKYIDYSRFAIVVKNTQGSMDIKREKKSIVNGMKCINPKTSNDNCLINAFKYITKSKVEAEFVRKEIKLEEGPLSIEFIPKLEEYYQTKVKVVTELKYDPIIENDNGNPKYIETKLVFTKIYGDDNCKNIIVFDQENNHFCVFEKPEYGKFCKYTGLPLKTKKEKSTGQANLKDRKMILKLKGFKSNKIVKQQAKEDNHYWFFDYETCYDDDCELFPYSAALVHYKYIDGKMIKQGEFFDLSLDCSMNLLQYMLKNVKETENNYLVGFNNARFDNFILLKSILQSMSSIVKRSVLISNGSLLSMYFNGFKVIDLYRFLMCSLKKACDSFKLKVKKVEGFDHSYIQDIYHKNVNNKDRFIYDLKKLENKIKIYNMGDVECLAELYFTVDKAFETIVNEKSELYEGLHKYITISNMSYSIWDSQMKFDKNKPEVSDNREAWDFMRSAAIGGRSQIFRKGKTDVPIQSLDVKSLYPFVMLECDYPIGSEIKTDKYVKGKMGIYECKITKQPKDNIIPLRSDDNPLDWMFKGEIKCRLTTIDIQTIKENGGEVEIYNGFYWENSSKDVFKSFLKPFKDAKTKQDQIKGTKDYNPALREVSKLAMNSLSGKLLQMIREKEISILNNRSDELNKFESTHTEVTYSEIKGTETLIATGIKDVIKSNEMKPCHLGDFVYSHARRHMYNSIIRKMEIKYATDTDSLHVPVSNIPKSEGHGYCKFNMGEEFGDFEGEIEFETKRSYYVAPKCYGLFGEDKSKMRFKGVGQRDKLIVFNKKFNVNEEEWNRLTNEEKIAKFDKLNVEEKKYVYDFSPQALSEKLYSDLVNGNEVLIMCSQIQRILNKKTGEIGLRQAYLIKTAKPTESDVIINNL